MTAAADVRRDSSTPRCDAPAVRRPCAGRAPVMSWIFLAKTQGFHGFWCLGCGNYLGITMNSWWDMVTLMMNLVNDSCNPMANGEWFIIRAAVVEICWDNAIPYIQLGSSPVKWTVAMNTQQGCLKHGWMVMQPLGWNDDPTTKSLELWLRLENDVGLYPHIPIKNGWFNYS